MNTNHSITLPAPAKVNLFLHILGRRENGYHNIQTVYQFISLQDQLTFRVTQESSIQLSPTLMGVKTADNLIVKAAGLLQQTANVTQGVDIRLEKHIPMGSGLGGGSSDAATTLLALNELWQTGLSLAELSELALVLGADVPVFLHGHAAWAEGIGEELAPIILPEPWYLILIPHCHCETKKLYHDPRLTRDSAALTIGHYNPQLGHNDFEAVVRMDYPAVSHALDWLGQFAKARMSGSGCAVFAGFDSQEEVSKIAAQVPREFDHAVAKGMNQSPLHEYFWGVAKR